MSAITAPLNPVAERALHRLELALADETVANFDHWGTVWGFSTTTDAATEIAQERTEGATVEEWETADRDGQSLRVARVTHPQHGIDIRVTSTWRTDRVTR